VSTHVKGEASRWSRFSRGWAAAGFATFVAALSHTLAGGGTPGLLAIVVSLAFAGIICIGMTGATASTWRTSVSVVASQLVFHGLFALTGPTGTAATTLVEQAPGAGHHHALALSVVTSAPSASHALHSTLDGGMLAAHVLAAIATIVALRHGEDALRKLLTTARLAVRILFARLVEATAPTSPRQTVHSAPIATASVRRILVSPLRHRGPPMPAGAPGRTRYLLSA
jgi:hypothetical protein